jgi:hypothetical protein
MFKQSSIIRIMPHRPSSRIRTLLRPAILLVLALLPACAAPAGVAFTRLDPVSYAVFVANWVPTEAPLCAVINDPDNWARLMHPAAAMGPHAPFAPAPEFWRDHAVLLAARVVPAGPISEMFHGVSVTASGGAMELDYRFQPPPAASYRIKAWLGVAVPRKPASRVVFRENGLPICTLDPARGRWKSPRDSAS